MKIVFMASPDIGEILQKAFAMEGVSVPIREKVFSLLSRLKSYHLPTYEHSGRVAFLASALGDMQNNDPRAGMYSALHDIGKLEIPVLLLDKTTGFNEEDMGVMRKHVATGYKILSEMGLNFSAWIALTHHRYQPNFYPTMFEMENFPFPIQNASPSTRLLADNWANIVSTADAYDAAQHRKNTRFGGASLSPTELKAWLIQHNPSSKRVIEAAYKKGIFSLESFYHRCCAGDYKK